MAATLTLEVTVKQRPWVASAIPVLLAIARLALRVGAVEVASKVATAGCRLVARHGFRFEGVRAR